MPVVLLEGEASLSLERLCGQSGTEAKPLAACTRGSRLAKVGEGALLGNVDCFDAFGFGGMSFVEFIWTLQNTR